MKSTLHLFIFMTTVIPLVMCHCTSIAVDHQHHQQHQEQHDSKIVLAKDLIKESVNQQDTEIIYNDAASATIAPQSALLDQASAQLRALNANPLYQNMKNSDAIAESLAKHLLTSNIRQGKVDFVPPNVVTQTAFRSVMLPTQYNGHQILTTEPLQPIVVGQPDEPPTHVYSGSPAIVRASPLIYKLKPPVVYQQEIINKIPTPLSLNPVYVKVYKPGKQINTPSSVKLHQIDNIAVNYNNQNIQSKDLITTDYATRNYGPISTKSYIVSHNY